MSVELAYIISGLSCVIAVLGFARGGKKDNAAEGEFRGQLKATLEFILADCEEIKHALCKQDERLEAHVKDNKESFERVHKRIDEHIRDDHGVKNPRADG